MEVGHLELASAVAGCGAPNFFRSFSQSPSKLPLDMISRRSLGLALAARNSAMASPPETTLAFFAECANACGDGFRDRGDFRRRVAAREKLRRARRGRREPALAASVSWKTLRRMELERGSRMAHRRRLGQRPRAASMVARTAVG